MSVTDIMLLAAQKGLIQVIIYFEMMANLNVANKFGDTMLHFEAKANQT